MTRIYRRLVEAVARMLEPSERDAVLGDLAESKVSGGQALWDLLGLIARRQAALWKDWRPWLALVGLVGLVGVRLNQISFSLENEPYLQLRTYWKHGVRYETGLTVQEETVVFLCLGLALLVWSWTTSFVLGSLSRPTLWITGSLYFIVWLYPLARMLYLTVRASYLAPSHRLDLSFFFSVLSLETISRMILFLVPSLWGVRQGVRKHTLPLTQTIALATLTVVLMTLATWTSGWHAAAFIRWRGGVWNIDLEGRQGQLLPFAILCWPIVYLLAAAISRRKTKVVQSLEGTGTAA